MKAKLMVMDSSGDTRVEFDTEVSSTERDEAKALFERLTGKGAAAFEVNRGDGKPDVPVKSFNDVQGEVVIVPLIVGG